MDQTVTLDVTPHIDAEYEAAIDRYLSEMERMKIQMAEKKFYDLAQTVLTFGQQTQRNQSNIETLQQEVKQLTGAIQRMAYEIQRLRDDFDHFKENERHEREKTALRLENEMLKFERRLPSGRQDEPSANQ